MFIQIVPQFMAGLQSFSRIQEFLLSETREDKRRLSSTSGRMFGSSSQSPSIELADFHRDEAGLDYAISVTDGAFGWKDNGIFVLGKINMRIKTCDLTMVIGPVGSGKSTLLKALLGETKTSEGQVYIGPQKLSFCDQTPWLMYGTIKENIIGMMEFDTRWYKTVLEACALQKDLEDMPDGDQTLIGSRGLALSGGQRQRIVRLHNYLAAKSISLTAL